MHSLFGSNPFATPVGQLVDHATSSTLESEDWNLNMDICDQINETEEGPKDAVRAIRKKLNQSTGKNNAVLMYTLTVLETCSKNCGHRFHVLIATKDFMQDMIKIITPKNSPPLVVQEKVLGMIQTWADAFKGQNDLKEVERTYNDLKQRGVEFPMTNLDSMVPINDLPTTRNNPTRTSPVRQMANPAPYVAPVSYPPQVIPAGQPAPVPGTTVQQPNQPVVLNPQQLVKLRKDLDMVETNVRIMGDMLNEFTSAGDRADPSDVELCKELSGTCRQMQRRLVGLLDQVGNEDVIGELLRINDEANNALLRFDRWDKQQKALSKSSDTASTTPAPPPPPLSSSIPSVIPPTTNYMPPSYESSAIQQQSTPATGGPGPAVNEPALIDFAGEPSPPPPSWETVQQMNEVQSRLAATSLSSTGQQPQQMPNLPSRGGPIPSSGEGQFQPQPTTISTHDDDFDMFAHSRQSFDASRASAAVGPAGGAGVGVTSTQQQRMVAANYSNQQADVFKGGLSQAVNAKTTNVSGAVTEDKPLEVDEMERWINETDVRESGGATSVGGPPRLVDGAGVGETQGAKKETMTSSEFDQFLAERITTGSASGATQPSATGGSDIDLLGASSSGDNSNRRMKGKDADDDAMFAL